MSDGHGARLPALASDGRRNAVSLLAAAVASVLALLLFSLVIPFGLTLDVVVLVTFWFWIVYAIAYAVLTHVVFVRPEAATLHDLLVATTPDRRRGRIEASRASAAPTANTHWALLAVLAVGLLVVAPGLLDSALANALAVGVVLSAWLVTVFLVGCLDPHHPGAPHGHRADLHRVPLQHVHHRDADHRGLPVELRAAPPALAPVRGSACRP